MWMGTFRTNTEMWILKQKGEVVILGQVAV